MSCNLLNRPSLTQAHTHYILLIIIAFFYVVAFDCFRNDADVTRCKPGELHFHHNDEWISISCMHFAPHTHTQAQCMLFSPIAICLAHVRFMGRQNAN